MIRHISEKRSGAAKASLLCVMLWWLACAHVAFCESKLRIGYIDYGDQWTKVEGVSQLLKSAGAEGTDLTEELRKGSLELAPFDCLIAGSFYTNDQTLRTNFAESRPALRSFVERGGTVVIFAQADQDSKQEAWLPLSLVVVRGDLDYSSPVVVEPDHSLFNTPNRIRENDLADWKILRWSAAWETFEQVQNVGVLAARDKEGTNPCALEAGWGKGRILLLAMAPDKACAIGNEKSKGVAQLLIQNVLAHCESVKAGAPSPVKIFKPRPRAYYPYEIIGTVFDDANGNGRRDAEEIGLRGIPVTDGAEIVFTDTNGRYELKNPLHTAKLVYVLQPSEFIKTNRFYHYLIGLEQKQTFDFGLKRSCEQATNNFRFVHVTDIHVSGAEDSERLTRALGEIAQLSPPPGFIIATGDLVNNGNYNHQLEVYGKAVESSSVTVFNVLGNHDACDGPDKMINYDIYLGPDYYSFDHGRCHFVIINTIALGEAQKQWVEQDVRLLGKGKEILAFVHYPHKANDLEWFRSVGTKVVFGGHWHTSKIWDYGSMRVFATPTLMMGAIDNSPAGFLVVDVNGTAIHTRYRFGGIEKKLAIVYPSKDFAMTPDGMNFVMANIYDSASLITDARFKISGSGNVALEGSLKPEGEFTWRAPVKATAWNNGSYRIDITATSDRNATWSAWQDFEISGESAAPVRVAKEWSMFGGTARRDGVPDARVSPPFAISWSAFTGGSIDFSSPILADKTIYIGVRDRNGLDHNGVMALNAPNGATKWFARTALAVNHSPAYRQGKIFATDVGGRLYALDASDGHEVWHYDMGSSTTRWIFSAPAIDKNIVFAGSSAYIAALDCETGSLIWYNKDGNDWITSYASPAIGDDRVLMGGMWIDIKGKSGSLYAMDKTNATVLWQADVLGLHGSPVIHKDTVFFNDSKGKFWAVDLKTGSAQWSYQMEPAWSAVTPAVSAPLVITGSGAGTLYAFDIATHQPVWNYKIGKSDFLMSPYDKDSVSLVASPVIVGDIVYVGASDGKLYALDKKTGKELWSHSFGVPVMSTPLVSGNSLFVATYDGHIYAVTAAGTSAQHNKKGQEER